MKTSMPRPHRDLRLFFCCTGVGVVHRGIESFFREAFDGLCAVDGLDITLYKGAGSESHREKVLWNLPRDGAVASSLGKLLRRDGYVVEQLSSVVPLVSEIRRERPDVIFYSDSSLGFQLFRWRKQIGVPFRLLFSNGGPCYPPFNRTDHVQQVAPYYQDIALNFGEPRERHSMVPYGINCGIDEGTRPEERTSIRHGLSLPVSKKIVLSVGWISATHKRMDYVISEIARLPSPRPHLVLLGQRDGSSQAIIDSAVTFLGTDGFTVRTEPYKRALRYYTAADLFVLGSVQEGFGRVYLEALLHGLPCVVHDHPVMRYVLGEEATFADLSQSGSLSQAVSMLLARPLAEDDRNRRRLHVERRFSWPRLAPDYRAMFYRAAARTWDESITQQ